MRYVKHFDINGVDARQVACIELHGAPNAATEGAVGVLGIDVDSPAHKMYKCVAVKGSIYTWEACEGNGSGGSGDIQTLDEMLQGFEREPGSVKKYVDSVAGSGGGGTGEDGGYYTPVVTDNMNGTMTVSFVASKSGMAIISPVTVTLPPGKDGARVTGIAEMGGDAERSTYRMEFSDGSGYDFDVYHGKTPVKGTDYWTPADKSEMVNDVLDALPEVSPTDIEGATEDLSAVADMTTGWVDGYYANTAVNGGGLVALNITSCGTTSAVTPGEVYEFTPYADPTKSPYSTITFYDANGGALKGTGTAPYYTFEVVDAEKIIYRVKAPANAAYAKYNVLVENKATSYIKPTTPMYSLPWLSVGRKNIAGEVVDSIADDVVKAQTAGALLYRHSLSDYDYSGKTITAIGDSITWGVASSPSGNTTTDSFVQLFAESLGMTLGRGGGSGYCITPADGVSYSLYKSITASTTAKDVFMVAGGCNDYASGRPLGTYGDTDTNTFYGALKGICEHFKTKFQNAKVVFITPIACPYHPDTVVAPLNAYRNAIYEVAVTYGFDVVDGSQMGFSETANGFSAYSMYDGCHPTVAGHALYAKNLIKTLQGYADGSEVSY